MPVIKSAIKKLRQDKQRTIRNNSVRHKVDEAVNKAKKETKDFSVVAAAYSIIDKAAKQGLIHQNKAARMKASLSKSVKPVKLSAAKSTKSIKTKSSPTKKAAAKKSALRATASK